MVHDTRRGWPRRSATTNSGPTPAKRP